MRALTISDHGGPEQLRYRESLPAPILAGAHDVRVRIRSAALNHLDLFVLEGAPGISIVPPWIPGSDGAGEIESVGSAVTRVKVGDRVLLNPGSSCGTCEYCTSGDQPLCLRYRILGEHVPGTLAEFVVVHESRAHIIPDGVTFDQAAAFPLATLTAWRMVVTRARVTAGEDVLIRGIGGGVAQAALQIAGGLGARVWVSSTSEEKLERARAMGADETLNQHTHDVGREARARTGKRGMDVVIDNVGVATWSQSLFALGRRGRLVTCGGTSGPMVETDVRRMYWNQWTLMGSTMGSDAEFDAIMDELRAGRLLPEIDSVFDLVDGQAAFVRLAAGDQFGKVVIRV
ncbi:MAG TPA: zinc-binding dehydrogenase [Gemmatimonadaceae bacterium]|nr:zinc-binding dehydrogenase [Gemmatimonadaceae bacterium]